jgi:hypothetical protein
MHPSPQPANPPASGVPFVPPARFDLSDRMLQNVADLWRKAVENTDTLTALEADMIAYSVAPFLDELQQRRAAMAMIETLTRPGTVVAFERRGLE